MLVRPAMKRLLCLRAKNELGRFALSALRFSGYSLILSCLTVSFSCGIVYSLVKRTPESDKKKTYAYLIIRKITKKTLLVGIRNRLAWPEETTKKKNIFMVCTGTKKKIFFVVILIPKLSSNFRTSWSVRDAQLQQYWAAVNKKHSGLHRYTCLLYTSPSPRD